MSKHTVINDKLEIIEGKNTVKIASGFLSSVNIDKGDLPKVKEIIDKILEKEKKDGR